MTTMMMMMMMTEEEEEATAAAAAAAAANDGSRATDDECDLLIEDKQHNNKNNSDNIRGSDQVSLLGITIGDGPTRRLAAQRATTMELVWSRVKSIIPGQRARDFGQQDDWTLDSGIIYRPNTIGNHNGKNRLSSLNNLGPNFNPTSNPRLLSFNWFRGSGSSSGIAGSKSHGFKSRDELTNNHRKFNNYYYLRNGPNKCRMLLTLIISLLTLVAVTFILVKLMNLLQEPLEKARISSQVFSTIKNKLSDHDSSSSSSSGELGYSAAYGTTNDTYNGIMRSNSNWIVSSPKCRIPNIEPWHESIRDYVELKPEYNCTDILITNKAIGQPDGALTFVYGNKLYFTDYAIRLGATKDCCYKQVTRSEDNDYDLVYSDNCIDIDDDDDNDDDSDDADGENISRGLKAPAELIQVKCSKFNYTNVHSFVIHDKVEEEASRLVADRKLNRDQYYNVVMLGVDTMSRLNGLRQLNKTLSLLRDKYKILEFTGYNKVGENTFPNLVPLLTGLTPEQLTETQCWLASNYSADSESGDDYMDNCKYLWSFYQELGYRTYFGEDWPAASTFNYLKQGFKMEPTNYYGRPFTIARDKLLLPPIKMGCTSPCLWDRSIVELDLFNLKNFIQENKHRPHFTFHWINCPQHDDLNGASRIDRLLEKFFTDIHGISQVDRTFVIFFSDHGYRWNNFVSTRVGHYESSLPMLMIAPPKHFIENHPKLYENLRAHTSNLITPFDLFKSMIDIRNLGMKSSFSDAKNMNKSSSKKNRRLSQTNKHLTEEEEEAKNNSKTLSPKTTIAPVSAKVDELGYTIGPTASTTIKQVYMQTGLTYKQNFKTLSLFSKYNSSQVDRSCIEAGIPDNYCVCHEFELISESTSDVKGASYYLVYVHLYSTIKNHLKLCHRLDLEKIHKAEVFDFKRMKSANSRSRRKRESSSNLVDDTILHPPKSQHNQDTTLQPKNIDIDESSSSTATTATPTAISTTEKPSKENENGSDEFLPNREYNIRFSTKPGGALFQEVVRFYGDNLKACESEVEKIRETIENSSLDHSIKHSSVLQMNRVCKFSVHSDSISRLNLYRDQSKCVKNNIEVKKVCYCNDLL